MPWTVKDVDKHKKGLTPKQKRQWVEIANSVLKKCQASGGSNCDAQAIRAANGSVGSKKKNSAEDLVMGKDTQRIPKGAMHFMDHGCFAKAVDADGEKVKLDMVVYSGGVIKGHWWWGDLALDLEGVAFGGKAKFPILENHATDRKIGFSGKPKVNGNLQIDPDTVQFVDTDASNEFIKLSKSGFPYESSLYGVPSSVERVSEGETADVNGMKFKGPGSIWRKWLFKEASVCVFGYDSNTRAAAFSDEEVDVDMELTGFARAASAEEENTRKEVKSEMPITVAQLKEEHPEVFEQIRSEAAAEAEAKFSQEKSQLKGEVDGLKTQVAERDERILKLEKNDAIRAEREMKAVAESIWMGKLAESEVPEYMFGKVRAMVSHTKFVADGILDREKFEEAIDNEIKSWEDMGITSTVLGTGFSSKQVDSEAQKLAETKKANDDTADELLALAGQPQNKS